VTRAAIALLAVASAGVAQTSRPDFGRVIAVDHLEPKALTVWILASRSGERSLVVARSGVPGPPRLRGRGLRDVILERGGRSAFVLVRDGRRAVLEQVPLESEGPSRIVVEDADGPTDAILSRSGDDVLLLTEDALIAVSPAGAAHPLFRREDARIAAVAGDSQGTTFATARGGAIEVVGSDGELLGSAGEGHSPAFLAGGAVAFLRDRNEPGAWEPRKTDVMIAGDFAAGVRVSTALSLGGTVSRLRFAGDDALVFLQEHESGLREAWLVNLRTRIARPIDPGAGGALKAAAAAPASRPSYVVDGSPVPGVQLAPRAEPETPFSGFFFVINEHGDEARTAYEESGWNDEQNRGEARVHQVLLERFLAGVQWPFKRDPAYEPFFATDDEPLRPGTIPHLGLDIGARLLHVPTGSVAFQAAGTPVYPLYRGGTIVFDREATLREGEGQLGKTYCRIVQEVELRDSGCVLRVHIAYEHVAPLGSLKPDVDPGLPRAVTGDDPIGTLEPYSDASPAGGWFTSDVNLYAAGIAKGNHVHVGIGGIYRSFNTTPEAGERKLRWYRERLVPALRKSAGPK
jgi:hypothetical protein